MAEQKKSGEQSRGGEKDPEKAADKATEQVQKAVDQENERGLRGTEVDTTPNEHYTVDGVLAGKPVPEAAEDPVRARREASSQE